MDIFDKTEALVTDIKEYISTRVELAKLETLDKSSEVGAGVVSRIIVALVAIFAVLFISLWLSLYLSDLLRVKHLGFLVVGAFYTLVFIISLMVRKSLLEKPIRDKIIAGAMANEDEFRSDNAERAISKDS